MDITGIAGLTSQAIAGGGQKIGLNSSVGLTETSLLTDNLNTDGTMFDSILNSAVSNINTTNSYQSDYENEQIKWALGETENTHDLTVAMQKATTALQYTVTLRDKILEAYKEIMNIQI